MTHLKLLKAFTNDALHAGKSRVQIEVVLQEAGWPQDQLALFWSKYHPVDFPVLVPKPMPYASPRLTTLSLFYFVVLYLCIYAGIDIIFTWLDDHLPDGHGNMDGLFRSQHSFAHAIYDAVAILIVCLPLVYWSNRIIQRSMRATGQYIHGVRLRLLNLTLFTAALIVLGTLISATYFFLEDELSVRFAIKSALLTALSFIIYYRFKPEIMNYEKKA